MKRILLLLFFLCFFLVSYGCKEENIPENNSPDTPEDNIPTVWQVTEIEFSSEKLYDDCFNDVEVDVVFTHSGGTELIMPAFWNSGKKWMVRFAPVLPGEWTYTTVCSDESNAGLHNQTGTISCREYPGDLDIYKHGFVKTTPGQRYFTYSDGTPFFYLGDTHWNMPANALDNFKTIIDKRVEQGFTVIQSEPIGAGYNLKDGITEGDLFFFSKLDERFKYIARKGFVHANAQFFFVGELGPNRAVYTDEYLEKLSRYWVARYASFPVLWTTAQEADNDFYHGRMSNGQDMNPYYDAEGNPWKHVASSIHKYDPYKHPLTAHMEFSSIGGDGTVASNSSFKDLPGHSWFGAQWAPQKNGPLNFDISKDFWNNGQGKPVVNYEGHYDHLWTNHFGARMQGWTAFLNGMAGHGYGAIDIWLYNSTYDMDKPSVVDGITITVADKHTKWYESMEFPSAYQMGYMHQFFKSMEWWKLTPRFDDPDWFSNDDSWYSMATIGNELYVIYFYNNINQKTGTVKNLENTPYTVQWFNPVTGESNDEFSVAIENNSYVIGDKPDNNDWVLIMKKS